MHLMSIMTSNTCLVLSGKGGVGKTTVFSNVATSLAMMGKKTVVIDADLAMANLALAFGFQDKTVTLHEVLAGKAPISDAIYEGPGGVKVVPSGNTITGFQEADPAGMVEVIDYFKSKVDYTLIDAPVGLNEDIILMLPHVDQVMMVVTPDLLSMADAIRMKVIAESFECNIYGAFLNRVNSLDTDKVKAKIEKTLNLKILSVIPDDPNIKIAAMNMVPLVAYLPDSPASIAIMTFAANMAGVDYIPPEKKVGVLQKLLGRLGVSGSENYGPN